MSGKMLKIMPMMLVIILTLFAGLTGCARFNDGNSGSESTEDELQKRVDGINNRERKNAVAYELEEFTIKNGKVSEDVKASNGKAVLVESEEFAAEKKIRINNSGSYSMELYINAPDKNKDGINIQVNDEESVRVYPEKTNEYMASYSTVDFDVKAAGEQLITVTASNEFGMMLDKVVIFER